MSILFNAKKSKKNSENALSLMELNLSMYDATDTGFLKSGAKVWCFFYTFKAINV